jgi:alpha-tubulin suppressor-like RCC1 family protein
MRIAAGLGHTCSIGLGGRLTCWGANDQGQLGDGTTTRQAAPVAVRLGGAEVTGATRVAAGERFTCAIIHDGTADRLYCWGQNNHSQLTFEFAGAQSSEPVLVSGVSSPHLVAAGTDFVCAVGGVRRQLWCWGNNAAGQTGNNEALTRVSRPNAVNRSGVQIENVIDLDAGRAHACAVLEGGEVLCWGDNGDGQLGDPAAGARRVVPGNTSPASTAQRIAVGSNHSCTQALTDGAVHCWGNNGNERLFLTGGSRATPEAVMVTDVSAGALWAGHATTCVVEPMGARCAGALAL